MPKIVVCNERLAKLTAELDALKGSRRRSSYR